MQLAIAEGETWAFYFNVIIAIKNQDFGTFYGKICLKTGNTDLLVLSAHYPDPGKDEL